MNNQDLLTTLNLTIYNIAKEDISLSRKGFCHTLLVIP